MTQNSADLPPILIERGSYLTHCGYAGRDKTELSFRAFTLDVESEFRHIFENVLKVDPTQYRVVVVKDAGTAQQTLREEARILFTKFQVKACVFFNAQRGILFSRIRRGSNALVIDIGSKCTGYMEIKQNKLCSVDLRL